jgi:hypothetical protein
VNSGLRPRRHPGHRERAVHRALLEQRLEIRNEVFPIDLRLRDAGLDGDHDGCLNRGCAGQARHR